MNPKPTLLLPALFLMEIIFVLGLAGCSVPTPTVTPGHALLYSLNFDHGADFSGWHTGSPGSGDTELENTQNGKYPFEFPSGYLENQGFDFADTQVAVDVEFLVKTPVEVGLACRLQPGSGGRYYFTISNDGRWAIRKWNNGETLLAEGRTETIQPGQNRLAARCVGDQLTLLANGVELGSAKDRELTHGSLNFGYAAENAGAGTFDNILVEDWGTVQTASPQPDSPPDETLYTENFDAPDKMTGWDAKLDEKSQANPQDGGYRLSVDGSMATLIQRQQHFADAIIEVDIQFLGQDPARAGVICRNAAGNYNFTLSSGGEWTIESSGKALAEGQTAVSPGSNHLVIFCVGHQLGLTLNEVRLGTVQDDAYQQGQIGFTLDSSGKAAALFDNLTIHRPATQAVDTAPAPAPLELATPTPAPVPTATPIPVPTPSATLRPTVIPEDALSLYQTEFDGDDPTLAAWKTFAYSMDKKAIVTEGYETFTNNGIYGIRQEANTRVFAIYDGDLGTADVDIATRGSAPFEGNGGLGLVCRYSEAGWYQFMVEPHGGMWSIRLVSPDENGQFHFHVISSASAPKWLSNKVDLRAECKGDRLTFYIDGEKMASVRDSTFQAGMVGFLGWSYTLPGAWNTLDRFSVHRAQWNETGLPGPAPTPGPDGTIYSTDFARRDELNPYWVKINIGVEGVPGSPLLVGGPGQAAPYTYQYINDFDPGSDVEISADVRGAWNWPRGLICRYSEDGWYETFYMKDDESHARVALVLGQRDEQGHMVRTILDTYYPPTADGQVNLSLTCASHQISVKLNGKLVLYREDFTWESGRYGFFFTDSAPGNLNNTLLNYTVRPVEARPAGEVVSTETFATPADIAAAFQVNLDDPRVQISENGLRLAPDSSGVHLFTSSNYGNGKLILDAIVQTDSNINLHCRSGSLSAISAELRGNGDWNLWRGDQELTLGNSPVIQPGKNQFSLVCTDDQVSLIANGETLAAVTLPGYQPASGTSGFDVFEFSAPVVVSMVRVERLTSSGSHLPAPTLLNRVSTPPDYQPGATLFAWDIHKFLSGCNSGWWGRDAEPCLWTIFYPREDRQRSLSGDQVLVKGYAQYITLFTYRPDLYDLPIEISAEANLTGKSGGAGLFCRATGSGRYEFYIQPDGKWSIRRNAIPQYYLPRAKDLTLLAHGTVDSFNPANLQMSAYCSGQDLMFTLNGIELGRVQDTLYPEGQAGIFFDVNSEGSFTNLSIGRAK